MPDWLDLIKRHCFSQEPLLSFSDFYQEAKRCFGLSVTRGFVLHLARQRVLPPIYIIQRSPPGTPICWHQDYLDQAFAAGIVLLPDSVDLDACNPPDNCDFGYSRFQLTFLHIVTSNLSVLFQPGSYGTSHVSDFIQYKTEYLRKLYSERVYAEVYLLMRIQTRYIPETKRHGSWTTTTVSKVQWTDWCTNFRPSDVLDECQLSLQQLTEMVKDYAREAHFADPLTDWQDLMQVISHRQKERVKGGAQLGILYQNLLQILYAYQRELNNEDRQFTNRLDNLDAVCSKYGIHPAPTLVIYVEDDGLVKAFIPYVTSLFWGKHSIGYGVKLESLGGTGPITQRGEPLFEAIKQRLLEGTSVAIISDNENQAPEHLKRLHRRLVDHRPKIENVDMFSYIFWERNFELDNFTDAEISSILHEIYVEACRIRDLPDTEPAIHVQCISEYRKQFPRLKIEDIFENAYKTRLGKVDLAGKLAEFLEKWTTQLASHADLLTDAFLERPVLVKLRDLYNLATRGQYR